jgi:hypothetical protein
MVCVVMLWMLPFLGFFTFAGSMVGGPVAFLIIPFAICLFIFAIVKIANAGSRTHARVEAAASTVSRSVTAPIPVATEPKQPASFDQKQAELYQSLSVESKARHQKLIAQSGRLRELASGVDDPETQAQLGPGLEKLQWFHLKFLLAREHLQLHTPGHLQLDLATKLESLRETLRTESLSEVARKSKESTLEMTEERLRNLENRQCRLMEIESDLERIESQLDLSLERAALQSSGGSSTFQLDLAERMVDSSDLFGSSLPLVSDLDAHFQGSMDRDTLR